MADIAKPVNMATPKKAVSGEINVTEPPDTVLLSPGVKEAMDRIFPKSASQLLQRELSFDDSFMSLKATKENLHFGIRPSPLASTGSAITLPYTTSTANVTTTVTTNIATSAASNVVTSAIGGSHSVRSSPYESAGMQQEVPPTNQHKKTVSKIRISKADFEIMTSCDILKDESQEKVSKRQNSVEDSSAECHSRDDSDSEDMRKPFASLTREKKKYKKRRKKQESGTRKGNTLLCEDDKNSKDEKMPKLKSAFDSESSLSDNGSIASHGDLVSRKNCKQDPPSLHDFLNDSGLIFDQNNVQNGPQNFMLQNGSLSNDICYKDNGGISEDFSNISYSSLKENVANGTKRPAQNLPKVKRNYFNIVKHQQKIKNTFLPCYVVVKKFDIQSDDSEVKDMSENDILPLSVRVKDLSFMCDKGQIMCKRKRKVWVTQELVYKNIFEETVLPGASEEEFESFRSRRGLRKRDKHVNYAEPTEDDIFDEYSRKRRRKKNKDYNSSSEDEGPKATKQRKKQNLCDSQAVNSNKEHTEQQGQGKDSEKLSSNKTKATEKDSRIISHKEVIVYPPASLGDALTYQYRAQRNDAHGVRAAEKSKYLSDINMMEITPPSANISVLPTSNIPAFTHHPHPGPSFPPLPLGLSPGLMAQSLGTRAPIPAPLSAGDSAHKPPQYCVVKMDGTDVLLQLVPSGGISMPMLMPKDKAVFVPQIPMLPGAPHVLGPPLRPTLSNSAVSASQSSSVSAASIQSLLGIPLINRPVSMGSQSMSMPAALPVIPHAQLAGLTSTAGIRAINLSTVALTSATNIRPINLSASTLSNSSHIRPAVSSSSSLTSTVSATRPLNLSQPAPTTSMASSGPINLTMRGKQIYQGVVTAQNRPGVEVSSTVPGTLSTAIRCVIASTASPQALSVSLATTTASSTSAAAQSSRTPGQTLQSIAPAQPGITRIFVPGSAVTGSPGQFSAFGSSPLTRLSASSELLPQRKTASGQDLTDAERMARRRKLEKKYPLPPGVVIKTEPLDTVPKPSTIITSVSGSRSLLPQNIQLLSTSRAGTGLSSIRIISPSLASALSGRNIRPGTSIIYRAAPIAGRQTVVLPTSVGQLTSRITTINTTTSLTTSSSSPSSDTVVVETLTNTTTAVTNTVSTCASSTSVTSVLHSPSASTSEGNPVSHTVTILPHFGLADSNPKDKSVPNSGSATTDSASGQLAAVNGTVKSTLISSHDSHPVPELCSSITAVSSGTNHGLSHPQGGELPQASMLDSIRTDLENLRKMIHIQEARGLKGERLEKLRELLHKKEERYKEVQKLSVSQVSGTNGSATGAVVGDGRDALVVVDGQGSSEGDPFIID